MNDIFAAMDQWFANRHPPEQETGEVRSVSPLSAQIAIGGSNKTQSCAYAGSELLNVGDTVLLFRNKRNPNWVISSVIGRARAGSSVSSRNNPNNPPGGLRWANINPQQIGSHSWSGTALEDILSITKAFNGGTPMLILNGYASPGASALIMDIGWGEDTNYTVIYKASLLSTVAFVPVSIADVGNGPLFGTHTFNIRGQLSAGAITPTLTYNSLKLLEI